MGRSDGGRKWVMVEGSDGVGSDSGGGVVMVGLRL